MNVQKMDYDLLCCPNFFGIGAESSNLHEKKNAVVFRSITHFDLLQKARQEMKR